MNSLFVISPYRHQGLWVFDDASVGLHREPFVGGADTIMDVLTENIPDAQSGFRLVFSAEPFPGYTAHFVLGRPEYGGHWYSWPARQIEGWLCPALFKYFPAAPPQIYAQASAGPQPGGE